MTFIRDQLERADLKFVNGYMDFFKHYATQQLISLQQNPGDIWRHVLAVLDTILDYAIQKQPSVLLMKFVTDASVIATHLTSEVDAIITAQFTSFYQNAPPLFDELQSVK